MDLLVGQPEISVFPPLDSEAEWLAGAHGADILEYLRAARATEGPVLDLGSGDGRFAVPLARQGFDVDAVDHDGPSLVRLRDWAGRLDVVQGRVTTIEADLAQLRLSRSYGLVMLAAGTVLELPRAVRPALFRQVAAHLRDGGVLALDYICARRPRIMAPGLETAAIVDDLRAAGLRIRRRDTRPLCEGLESTFLLCAPRGR
ncbi:class I SAM-dependent methyltransferase [Kitasatospora acidiphila]|uniref:class I SAM-dependent methyltransferase n=1 Tax=Kitasatospora acidiphila TaxID=2567942 RepID=UPI003C781666